MRIFLLIKKERPPGGGGGIKQMMTLRLFEKQVLVNRRLREEEMEHDRQLRAGHDGDVELDCHQHPYFLDRIDWVGLRRRFRLGKDITGGVDLFN